MMGDDMAIRSGGMYGNPESNYTVARPYTQGSSGGGITLFGRFMKAGINMGAAFGNYWAETTQIHRNLKDLQKEKEYNIKNFEQHIADTLAQNKMSFYSSGLDIKSGTAQDVMISNRNAMLEDLTMLSSNYASQERSLAEKKKAARGNLVLGVANSIISAF